mmetsp:Transcript_28864/g.54114  ORF Transcript_28864/g.54114 Transcript_28864/m.54114 type:complete len:132 (-) Transcript_28864:43-438(-)
MGPSLVLGHHYHPAKLSRQVTSFPSISELLAQPVDQEVPEDPPEEPPPKLPPAEIHLPADGPIGDGYEVILDVPPTRHDGFAGPAMQPYHAGMLSSKPVLMSNLGSPTLLGREVLAFSVCRGRRRRQRDFL